MKIRVNGKTHSVDSPASKAALLERLAKEAQDQAAIAEGLGDSVLASKIKKSATRIDARARSAWIERLRKDDEQLMGLL